MRIIATDVPVAWASVSQYVMRLRCANTAERIEVLFAVEILGTCERGSDFLHGFDAAFAKLLWPLFTCYQ